MNKGLEEARRILSRGRNLITLREARENAHLTVEGAAERGEITATRLKGWEINCGKADTYLFLKLLQVYGTSSSHVYAGKEADLLAARREASTLEKKTIRVEDIVTLFKHMGRDTTELEKFLEEIRASWEAETKNAPATGIAKASVNSHM